MTKISDVKHDSKVRFELDGKTLTGRNWRNGENVNFVCVFGHGPSQTVELPPDKEVEVLEVGGFQLELSAVRMW